MKTLITVILVAIISSTVGAINLGLVGVNDTLTFPIICLDTLGREVQSDSNHVIVWYGAEGANDYTYSERDVTGGANPAWIDSVNLYGGNSYYFMDLVDDIDSNRSNGSYSGKVVTWKQGYAFSNPFSFTKVGDATAAGDNILNHFIVDVQPDVNVANMDAAVIKAASFASGAINATAIADRALSLAKFDTAAVAAFYFGGIWLDGGAANTDSDVGVDGTPSNPVSTVAAARILADSMGLQKYYIINGSSFTLDATYENWEFIGIGEGSLINFGSQDVDGSAFNHLMISGTQGGTGVTGLHDCYLNTIDSLEAIVINSSLSDTISLRVSGNTAFDQCYSNVAGNNTPGLDFNSAGTIDVSFRHYSGGLALFNGISTHTISYESDGQLVIDASCTSINVTARGNMTITDNGTTTALTENAVFNQDITQQTLDVVNSIALTGTNLTTIAEADSLTDGIETNTFVATQIHDGTYYQIAESDGVVGTNLNINTFLQFDIGPDTRPVSIIHHGRLDEGSAPSGGDTLHIWVYDWSGGGSWTHINPPSGDFVGIFNSSSSDDETSTIQLIDPNYVSNDSGKVRIAYSNYDPDGATANNLEEDTEFFLDYAFLEYQSVLTAAIIAASVLEDSLVYQNMTAVHDDAVAAGRFETMLDGTGGQTLSLGGLDIRSGSDTALVITSTGADAVYIEGGTSSDAGVRILAGSGSGKPAVYVEGDGTAPGAQIIGGGTNAHGLSLQGSGSGFDLNATLNLDDLTGTLDASEIGADAIGASEFAADAVDKIANYAFYVVKGDVDAGSFGTMGFTSDALTQGDDYWILNMIHFFSGNLAGQTSIITDFTTATDSVTNAPAFTAAPVEGDSFKIMAIISPNVSARTGFVLANLTGGAVDVIWNEDTTGHGTAQSFAVMLKDTTAYQGAGAGLSAADIWNYNISNFQDTTSNLRAGQYQFSVGLHNVSQNAPTVQMKLGTGYDGTDGKNVEDDFDSVFVDIAALGSGSGPRLCSLFVATGAGAAMTSGFSRMTSGAITWTSDINGDGYAIYGLTDATWSGLVYVTAHTQDTIPQTFVVTASFTDTITVTPHTINTPSDTGKVNLYLYTDRILGDTLEGAIMTISPIKKGKNWKTDGGRLLILGDASATANSDGLVQIEVYQSSFVHPYKWSRSLGAYTTGSDSLEYKITVSYGELAPFVVNFFVAPDSGDTYQIGGE